MCVPVLGCQVSYFRSAINRRTVGECTVRLEKANDEEFGSYWFGTIGHIYKYLTEWAISQNGVCACLCVSSRWPFD